MAARLLYCVLYIRISFSSKACFLKQPPLFSISRTSFLSKDLFSQSKATMSEISVAQIVDMTRETQAGFVGAAMRTRVAFGPSGAEPDYRAAPPTNRRIFTNSTLIIRSGGQYDGKNVYKYLYFSVLTKVRATNPHVRFVRERLDITSYS